MRRGRRPSNPEFSELNRLAAATIRFDCIEDYDEIHRRLVAWEPVRGITHCPNAAAHEDRWYVKLSVGGKVWTLGAFPALEASKIWDAAFVKFKPYRRRQPDELMEKSWLNWSRRDAEDNIANNEPLQAYLFSLEKIWRNGGYLKSAERRTDEKAQRAKAYERRRSTQGIVDGAVHELQQFIFDLPTKEDLDRVEKKLDTLLSRGNLKQNDNGV